MSGSSSGAQSSTGSPLSSIYGRSSTRSTSQQSRRPDFIYRNGSRFHSYSKEEVPYPFSFDKEMIELYLLDHQLIWRVQDNLSFIDFKGNPPKRCLDLGCGSGDWIIDVAKVWTESTFVGFDIADVQLNLKYVEPSIARRIKWVHGNILKPLPFEDNSFDYVHVSALGLSIPEDKWHLVFDEISRVVVPGGYVEDIEEDAIFPVLPKWFTRPLHEAGRCVFRRPSASPHWPEEELPHDHALLESLFYSVFESRFINPEPSSILPGYFSATFKHVISPPVLYFPMPPLPPLPPLSHEVLSQSQSSTSLGTPTETSSFLTASSAEAELERHHSPARTGSPRFLPNLLAISEDTCCCPASHANNNSNRSGTSVDISIPSEAKHGSVHPALAERGETTEIGGAEAYGLYNMKGLTDIDDHTLFVHLQRAAGLVWGVKEAMWDELWARVHREDGGLVQYGWRPHDYTEAASRKKFDILWERYRADMHERTAMWHVMMHYGWSYPRQRPMTHAEVIEQGRLRQAILDARTLVKGEDQPPVRSIRLLVGVNSK